MMTKSSVLLFLVLGLISVQISSANPTGKKSSSNYKESGDQSSNESLSDEYDVDVEDDEGTNEENPAMSCLLFGDRGCHTECAIVSQIYKFNNHHGNCDSNQKCHCSNYIDQSFHEIWDATFDDDYVYRKIINDDAFLDQALRILGDPFQTVEQFKEHFYPIISPYQFSKLKTNDKHSAVKYTKDGRFDREALQKYVVEMLKRHLKSNSGKSLLNSKYKEKFSKALENSEGSKGTLYNLTYRVKQLENKTLENVLEEYLKKKKIEKPKIEIPIRRDNVHEIVDIIFLNELIKLIEEESKDLSKSSVATATNKPSSRVAFWYRRAKKNSLI